MPVYPTLTFKNISGSGRADGTHNTGTIIATYDKLVSVFGEPEHFANDDDDKTQVRWTIEWDDGDGVISTIYDWKWYGVDPKSIVEWNIGGIDYRSAAYVIGEVHD